MRILHVTHQYLPEHVGGVELYTQSLSRALAEQGHTVAIVTRREQSEPVHNEVQVEPVRVYGAHAGSASPTRRFAATFGHAGLRSAFADVVAEFRPDLVHLQHLMGWPIDVVDELHKRQLPYVATLHDYWWVCPNANLLTNDRQERCDGPRAYLNCTRCLVARAGSSRLSPLLWGGAPVLVGGLAWRAKRLRQALCRASRLLTPSAFVRDWYISQGVPAGQIQACELGVERPSRGWAAEPRPPGSPIRFLYLGGIAPLKGVHVIIEALRGVQGAAELWVAGDLAVDPIYSEHLRTMATPQTSFLGRLTRDQVWTTLGQVDVVLAPSLWHETYCLAVREAQVAGVPVIAAHAGALAEAVQPEVNGLLAPPGDVTAWQNAMQRCVAEPALLARWRANSPQPPTMAAHVAKVTAVYQSIMMQGHMT